MKPIYTKYRVVGLLGGSFNPAHDGHVQVSVEAIKRLKLDAVWWLVSPQNPLKPSKDLAPYAERLRSAKKMTAKYRKIFVSDIETKLHSIYTVDTIQTLQRRFPGTRFVWLMGADNLAQFHRWRKWDLLCRRLPIAVFDRAPFSHTAIRAKGALHMHKFRMKNNDINHHLPVPSLVVSYMRRNPASSTALRKRLEKRAF